MAEIKKKSTLECSARIIDRTTDAGTRIKDITLKTKDAMQKNRDQKDHSPSAYASERTTDAAKAAQNQQTQGTAQKTAQAVTAVQKQPAQRIAQSTAQKTQAIAKNPTRQTAASGRKAASSFSQTTAAMPQQPVSSRIRSSGGNGIASNRVVSRARNPSVQNTVRTVGRPIHTQTTMMSTGRPLQTVGASVQSTGQVAFATQRVMQRTMAASGQTMQTAKYTIRNASDFVRVMARATASAFRITIGSTRALLTALLAGAWLFIMIIVVIALFGGAIGLTGGDGGTSSSLPVSAEVESYEPLIRQYAVQYGIPEYVDLIKAVMMQESGGRGGDPMKASEGEYNTRYSKSPNSITDPEYSISCGVQELKHCLEKAGVENPIDLDHIRLALQGYNYGDAYITWRSAITAAIPLPMQRSIPTCKRNDWDGAHMPPYQFGGEMVDRVSFAQTTFEKAPSNLKREHRIIPLQLRLPKRSAIYSRWDGVI